MEKTSGFVEGEIGKIYDGQEYCLQYILSEMQHTIVPNILHPALLKLKTYDQTHHTAFYETLYVYLKNGKSIIDTTREMNLHRNTLLYRLKRLEELLDADLEDPMVRLHLWISFEIEKSGA